MVSPRLSAKLERPTADVSMVRRSQQVDQLRRAVAPLIVLSAPPGFGKTTLLAQWAEEDERPFRWISLDAGDNDPAVLLRYLMRALADSVAFGPDVLEGPIDDQEFLQAVTLPRLGHALAHHAQRFVLVLDDTHVLQGTAWELLARLVDEVPTGSQIVLSGRTEPALAIGRLLTHRRLVRFLPPDLAMTVSETQMLARSVGLELDASASSTLVARTEGWPAGLYLAVLSLRSRPDLREAVSEFSGNDRLVSEYVADELLSAAAPDVHRFLLRTSILRTLSGQLCDAVLRSRGSSTTLDRISRSNALLTPLGRDREWYRYHQLFADVLRAELHRSEPEIELELHHRASVWYEAQGDAEEAIAHAHASGNEDRAAELVWQETAAQLTAGRLATLERWLAAFDTKRSARDPLLALAHAGCALAAGRPVEPWLALAAHTAAHPDAASGKHDRGQIGLVISLFRAVMARSGAVQMVRDAEEVSREAPTASAVLAVARYLRGAALDQLGDPAAAEIQLQQGAVLAARLALPGIQSLCLGHLTFMAFRRADWSNMQHLAAQTSELVEAFGLQDDVTTAPVHAALALALAHDRRAHEAARAGRRASRLLATIAPIAPWLDVHTRAVLARTHLLLGDAAAARSLLAEAQQAAGQIPDASQLLERLDELWTLAQAVPLTTHLGPSCISPAELRVLRLLPTGLTFAQIADALSIHCGTVRTRALSTYRKLGVDSRSGAVGRALALGFISELPDPSGAPSA
ncbi:MAG TPA: AAA family ATPase [Frankiaceae bacterium]|nr:AAA family ATPase [Frankiaceae bacterium]